MRHIAFSVFRTYLSICYVQSIDQIFEGMFSDWIKKPYKFWRSFENSYRIIDSARQLNQEGDHTYLVRVYPRLSHLTSQLFNFCYHGHDLDTSDHTARLPIPGSQSTPTSQSYRAAAENEPQTSGLAQRRMCATLARRFFGSSVCTPTLLVTIRANSWELIDIMPPTRSRQHGKRGKPLTGVEAQRLCCLVS